VCTRKGEKDSELKSARKRKSGGAIKRETNTRTERGIKGERERERERGREREGEREREREREKGMSWIGILELATAN